MVKKDSRNSNREIKESRKLKTRDGSGGIQKRIDAATVIHKEEHSK